MPTITIAKTQQKIIVPAGANLMQALLDNGLPVASSCNGEAACGKCKIKILHGQDTLTRPNSDEKFLLEKLNISKEERISCQVQIYHDVTVDTGYW